MDVTYDMDFRMFNENSATVKPCATKAKKPKRGRRSGGSTNVASVTVIHALAEIYGDKMLNQAISSLLQWSAQITGGRGSQISYTCSADGVTVQGKGWRLNIDDISSLTTERREYENLRKILERLMPLKTGKK